MKYMSQCSKRMAKQYGMPLNTQGHYLSQESRYYDFNSGSRSDLIYTL